MYYDSSYYLYQSSIDFTVQAINITLQLENMFMSMSK